MNSRKYLILLLTTLFLFASCSTIREYHGRSEKVKIGRGKTLGIMAYTWTGQGMADPGSPIGSVIMGEMLRSGYNIKAINIFSDLAVSSIKNFKKNMIDNLNNVKVKGSIKDLEKLLADNTLSFFEKEEKAQQLCSWFQKELGMEYLMLVSRQVGLGKAGVTYFVIVFKLSDYQLVFTQSITLKQVAESLPNVKKIVLNIIIPALNGEQVTNPKIMNCKFKSLTD